MIRIFALSLVFLYGAAFASEPPSPAPTKSITQPKTDASENHQNADRFKQDRKDFPSPIPIIKTAPQHIESTEKADDHNDYTSSEWWLVYITAILSLITLGLAISTYKLWKDASETSKRQDRETRQTERSFVFIDGFNFELTTPADTKNYPIETLPASYKECPHLWITRFCVQPRWRNSGNTPTRKMTINVAFGYNALIDKSESINPVQYVYTTPAKNIFLSPQAVTESEFVYIQGIQEFIDYGMSRNTIGNLEPIFLIWGRADYEDIFGKSHFIEWCYRIRLDDHRGEGLRATFTQWGDYNSSDEDQNT